MSVSFGGIAGLFLGFSLLSGVEILYYFTMRTCCMVMREKRQRKEQLKKLEALPRYDSSLVPIFTSKDPILNDMNINLQPGVLSKFSEELDRFRSRPKQKSIGIKSPFGIEFIN